MSRLSILGILRLNISISLNNLGVQGHIEDVVVAANHQGKKFGSFLIKALDYIGRKTGCYKVCSYSNMRISVDQVLIIHGRISWTAVEKRSHFM